MRRSATVTCWRRAAAGYRAAVDLSPQRHGVGQRIRIQQPGLHPVVHVMVLVGDLVGHVDHLGLERRLLFRVIVGVLGRDARVAGAGVLGNPLADLVCEVEPHEVRIALLEVLHDAQRLAVVVEPAVVVHQTVQHLLAEVPEGGVPQIVRQRQGLGHGGIEAQG
jgi:hypothetical protein